MFRRVWFDISGSCNGRCPWCQTGQKNRLRRSAHGGFVSPDDFARAVEYMIGKGIIAPGAPIELYNFGEPFLHPQFNEIIAWLGKSGQGFGLSTNGSRPRALRGPVLSNLQYLVISMPGFSQKSYDRIHGLDFEAVKANIVAIAKNFRECGFRGPICLTFHVYQFNLTEIDQAQAFALDHGFGFDSYYAFFNDLDMYLSYRDSTMPHEQRERASQELMLDYLDGLLASQPSDFRCSSWDDLVLNERRQVVLCCMVDKNEGPGILGNLSEMSGEDIRKAKSGHKICDRCLSSGCAYLACNPYRVLPKTRPSANVGAISAEELAQVVFVERPPACAGFFERAASLIGNWLKVEGWARDPVRGCPPQEILVLNENREAIACEPVNIERDDVIRMANLDPGRMRNCGWRIHVQLDLSQPQYLTAYALNRAEKVAYRLANRMRVR